MRVQQMIYISSQYVYKLLGIIRHNYNYIIIYVW